MGHACAYCHRDEAGSDRAVCMQVDHEVLSPSLTPSPAEPSNTDHIKEVEAKMAECKARAVALKNEVGLEAQGTTE